MFCCLFFLFLDAIGQLHNEGVSHRLNSQVARHRFLRFRTGNSVVSVKIATFLLGLNLGALQEMSTTLLTLEELADLEERQSHILPAGTLMDRAGFVIANWIDDQCDAASTIVILCGPGNNGGDGYTAAAHLKGRGHHVICVMVGGKKPKTEDAQRAYQNWLDKGGEVIEDPYMAPKADVVVDAMFGVGISKPISGDFIDAVLWFNERQALHMALDIPTGIDAEKGTWVGGIKGCMADMTLNLISAKAGCFMNDGKDASGMVTLSELDVSVPLASRGLIDTDDFKHILELRKYNSHKGTYGHVVVIGGAKGKTGAAIMAARSALKLGAGSVTVELMLDNPPAYDPVQPELMITNDEQDLSQADAIVIGCGMGFSEQAKKRLVDAINTKVPLIIDADALTMISQDQALEDSVLGRRAHTVMTPHPGEAARLLHRDVKEIQADRMESARELALQTGAIVVLKGTGTVVALRSSRTWVNPTGSACLSTAGTGDVLAGMIASFFAQKFDMVSATLGAVWLHGEAVRARNTGIVAMDVAERAARALEILRWGGNPDDLIDPYDESEFVLDEDGPGEALARTMGSEEA